MANILSVSVGATINKNSYTKMVEDLKKFGQAIKIPIDIDTKNMDKLVKSLDISRNAQGDMTKEVQKYNVGIGKTLTIQTQIKEVMDKETGELEKQVIQTSKINVNNDAIDRARKKSLVDVQNHYKLEQEAIQKTLSTRQKELEVLRQQAQLRVDNNEQGLQKVQKYYQLQLDTVQRTAQLRQKELDLLREQASVRLNSGTVNNEKQLNYEIELRRKIKQLKEQEYNSTLSGVQSHYKSEQDAIQKNIQLRKNELELIKEKAKQNFERNSISRTSEAPFSQRSVTSAIDSNFQLSGKSAKESAFAFENLFQKADKSRVGLSDVEKQVVKLNPAMKEATKHSHEMGDSLSTAAYKMLIWTAVGGAIFGAIRQIKEAFTFINDLNKSMTNIEMITGKSREQIVGMTQDYVQLASVLHDTTANVMQAAEEFLRAGHSQDETLKLLQASTVMSKIAGQDQKSTADQMIAITNAYKMNINDVMGVVDKLTTVDNMSATSTKELGLALERTSASAQMANVPLEKLVGWVATVSSVTRKSASSIGESFKTIFSRFQDVKGGKTFDADNENISNVERDFQKYAKISIRSSKGQFKDFGIVLDELSGKWANLSQVQQSAIAKALAGTRQRENFLVLMNNYNTSLKLEQAQLNSNGSAMQRYGAYAKSTEAKINDLVNALQKFYIQILKSDTINSAVGGLTSFVEVISRVITGLGGLQTALLLLSAGGLIKFLISLSSAAAGAGVLEAALVALQLGVEGLSASLLTLLANPITWLVAAVVGVVGGIFLWTNHVQKLKEQNEAVNKSQTDFNKAIKDFNDTLDPQKIKDAAKALEDMKKTLEYDDKIKKLKEMKDALAGLENVPQSGRNSSYIQLLKNSIKDYENSIQPAINAQKRLTKEQEINTLIDYKSAEGKARSAALSIQQANANLQLANSYKAVYDKLVKGLPLTQEETSLNNQLLQQYPQYSKMVNDKTKAIGVNYNELQKNLTLQQALAVAEFSTAQQSARLEIQKTDALLKETNTRIGIINSEIDAMNKLNAAKKSAMNSSDPLVKLFAPELPGFNTSGLHQELVGKNKLVQNLNASRAAYATIANSRPTDILSGGGSSGGYIPPNSKKPKGSGTQSAPSQVSETMIETDRYANLNMQLEITNVLLAKNKAMSENVEGAKKVKLLNEEIQLLKQKQTNLQAINEERRKERNELKNTLINSTATKNKKGKITKQNMTFSGIGDSLTIDNATEILRKKKAEVNAHRNDKNKTTFNNLVAQYNTLDKNIKRFIEIQSKEIPQLQADWYGVGTAIGGVNKDISKIKTDQWDKDREIYQKWLDKTKTTADTIVETMKKAYEAQKNYAVAAIEQRATAEDTRHEKALENIDTESKKTEDAINAQMKLLDEQANTADYNKQLATAQKERQDIANKISVLSLDTSYESISQRNDLTTTLTAKDEEIAKMKTDRDRELRKNNLQDQLDANKTLIDAKKTLEDKSYKTAKDGLDKEKTATQNYYDGLINDEKHWSAVRKDIIAGNLTDVQTALTGFLTDFQSKNQSVVEGLGLGWKELKNNIDAVNQAQSSLSSINYSTQDKWNSSNDNPLGMSNADFQTYVGNKSSYESGGNKTTTSQANSALRSKYGITSDKYSAGDLSAYLPSFDTGGMVSLLHEKEIVLNKDDTKNLLGTISMVRNMNTNLSNLGNIPLANNKNNGNGNGFSIGEVNLNIASLTGDQKGVDFLYGQFKKEVKKLGGRF